MAHKAKDGSEWTNKMMANRRDASMAAKMPKMHSATMPQSMSSSDESNLGQSQDGQSDPEADHHTDAMLNMGMSPDDIHEHAKKRAGKQMMSEDEMPMKGSMMKKPAMSSMPGM